jgi:hypothetical protein
MLLLFHSELLSAIARASEKTSNAAKATVDRVPIFASQVMACQQQWNTISILTAHARMQLQPWVPDNLVVHTWLLRALPVA